MRRKAFLFLFSLSLAALLVFVPADLAAARLVPAEAPIPVVTQEVSADEKALIDDILLELDKAKGMTGDSDLANQIDTVADMVRKIIWLGFTNQGDATLKLKYVIAERLEQIINELPLASPGMATTAASTEANPVYEELVRVRAKIDKLIAMETVPEAVPPKPPTLDRTPEAERLVIYSAKFLCGPAFGNEGVQRGSYSTAVNIHNPHDGTVYLYKKAVIANREDDPRGKISPFRKVALGPDEAIEIDCVDIHSLLGSVEEESSNLAAPSQQLEPLSSLSSGTEGEQTAPSISRTDITPVSSLVQFIKGFVVIYASAPLDVVGVYTASTPDGFSLDVEYISPSRAAPVPVNPPECPQGCQCLTKVEAEKAGLTAPCGGEVKICGYDDCGNERYCFTKPGEVICPDGCVCLTEVEAKRLGLEPCGGKLTSCGKDAAGNVLYCYEKPTEGGCPDGCVCLSERDATAKGLTTPCLDAAGNKIICGRDAQQNTLLCWKVTEETGCPSNCVCLTEVEAKKLGLQPCGGKLTSCGKDAAGNVLYCYEKPTEQVECPDGCVCLSERDATAKGLTTPCLDAAGNKIICGWDAQQNALLCWKTTQEVKCPTDCYCATAEEAKKLGYSLCGGKEISCGTDAAGNALYCFEKAAEEPECPQGCVCLTELEARKGGYTFCGGKQKACGYVYGGAQKWCYEKGVATRMSITPSQASNAVGTGHAVVVTVYDQYGKPLSGAKVTINVSGANNLASATITTGSDGEATFEYTGSNAGNDTIVATIGGLKATAYKTWYKRAA